eukprot:2981585-Pyramimonas_sp.AAC.1
MDADAFASAMAADATTVFPTLGAVSPSAPASMLLLTDKTLQWVLSSSSRTFLMSKCLKRPNGIYFVVAHTNNPCP